MALKLFSKLFSRNKRIAMTSDEAFLSDESDEPQDEVQKEEPAPQPTPSARRRLYSSHSRRPQSASSRSS